MLFPPVTFAIFFMIVLPVSWLLMPRPRRWKLFMLVAAYYFYGYWNWRFVFLIIASTIWNHVLARLIHAGRHGATRRTWLAIAVAGNLGVLGYFKYYDFFITSAHNLFDRIGIGISPEI